MTDLRFALRTLVKTPGFTVVIILTLALGIGANTALFSVINTTLLRPLPYKDAERLVELNTTTKTGGSMSPSYPDFLEFKKRQRAFDSLSALYTTPTNLTTNQGTERVSTAFVDHDFFRVFGVAVAAGSDFSEEDDRPASAPLVLISHDAWQKRFGGAPDMIGRQILLAGKSVTIAGILPGSFHAFRPAEFYTSLSPFVQGFYMEHRNNHYGDFSVIGRLKSGVSMEAARSEMAALAASLEKTYPETNSGNGASLTSLQERLGGGSRETLYILLGAVGMVLLIACVNVANMLLSRACAREREMAVRAALGASRMRIVRQLLSESLLLAGAGGIIGIIFGQWLYSTLGSLIPYNMRVLSEGSTASPLDWRVISFSLAVSMITGIAFGLAPAWQLSHASPHDALKERSSSGSRRIGRFRISDILVVTEVALAAMLLIGAGLMIRSVWSLKEQSLGFQPEHLITLKIASPASRMNNDWTRAQAFYEQASEVVRALPGVESVGIVNNHAFDYGNNSIMFYLRDKSVPAPGEFPTVRNKAVDPDYFKTLGIAIIRGRVFERTERRPPIPPGAEDMGVIMRAYRDFVIDGMVSKSFANHYWPNEDAVGKVIRLGTPETPYGWVQITGVVDDSTQYSLKQQNKEELFLSFRQWSPPLDFGLVIKARGDPAPLVSSIRKALQDFSKLDPVYSIKLQTALIENSLYGQKFNSQLFGFFAAVALALSLIGIYGVLSFAVSRRTREFGIRIALGAEENQVLGGVLLRGLKLIVPGIVIGLSAAWMLGRMIQSQLYGITPTDPSTYALVALVLLFTALVACWLPARRATRVNPVEALRAE
jgi:putative ABC transport system permease protein